MREGNYLVMRYNKYVKKVKITKYKEDPKRVGYVVTVQVASKLRKSHKFGSNVKKPPQAPT
jgi:hypothetical protein